MNSNVRRDRELVMSMVHRAYEARQIFLTKIAEQAPELKEPAEDLFAIIQYEVESLEALMKGEPMAENDFKDLALAHRSLSEWLISNQSEFHGLLLNEKFDYHALLETRQRQKHRVK